MIRTLDPEPFNRIFNDPEIRPWMGYGTEPRDLTPVVRDTANFCFLTPCSQGGYIVARLADGLYVAHTLALPAARGKPMLRLMDDGFRYMFTATDAEEIVTTCPDGNAMGARWADRAGFVETHRRENAFPLGDQLVGASYRSLLYRDWVVRDRLNIGLGEMFHERLHAENPALVAHPEDKVHDAWVGATLAGCGEGNIVKSIRLFNRWAVQTGYMPAAILSERPPVIDTGDAIMTMIEGQRQVLRVKVCETEPVAVS